MVLIGVHPEDGGGVIHREPVTSDVPAAASWRTTHILIRNRGSAGLAFRAHDAPARPPGKEHRPGTRPVLCVYWIGYLSRGGLTRASLKGRG